MSNLSHDAASCADACPLATASGVVARRAFLSQSVLAAAALALAACGGGGDSVTAPSSVGSTLKVGDYPGLAATGGVAVVTLNGTRLAIVRTGTAAFAALSLVCPHEGGSINANASGTSTFLCSKHGARFDAEGRWTGGERTSNMRSYGTTYDATAGTLTIA